MRLFLFLAAVISSLPSISSQPYSWQYTDLPAVPVFEVEGFDREALMEEADRMAQLEGRAMDGKLRFTDFDFFEEADSHVFTDGTTISRLTFFSEGARSLSVYFDDFHLPVGCELFIYNADRSYFEGPYTYEENNGHHRFMTNDIWGEQITLEFIMPQGVVGTPRLDVMAVGYLFQYVTNPLDQSGSRGGSQPCQVDVNCPEAEDWLCQKDAVTRLRVTDGGASFVCSGVMVNNTAEDCRQLLLSALHCAEGVSAADLAFLQVRYQYERSQDAECGEGGFSSSRNRTGVILLGDSNDNNGGGFDGSDFIIFEVEDDIPDSWNPYFAGWDARNNNSSSGVGIHHPSGDIKKISTYTSSLSSVSLGALGGSHWEVEWSPTATDHGVTEPGSSGSPIFSSEKLVIGTLSAGFSACEPGGLGGGTGPNEPDYYGKVSWHWDNNPNPQSEKLKNFLDPLNVLPAGAEFYFGAYRPCNAAASCEAVTVEETLLSLETVQIAPNPAVNGVAFLRVDERIRLERMEIYDAQGRLMLQNIVNGPVQQLDLNGFAEGTYYVTVTTTNGASFTQRLLKL